MAQAIQEFTPFTDTAWEIAKKTVSEHFGMTISADSGKISHPSDQDPEFQFDYTYDRAQKLFRIQLLRWPWYMPAGDLNQKIHMLCENAMIQGEEHAAKH